MQSADEEPRESGGADHDPAPVPGPTAEGHPDAEAAERLAAGITEHWLAKDAKTSYDLTETFPFGARMDHRPVLAQRLHDEGLLYAINRLVLHPLGMALGVGVQNLDRETMRAEVWDLNLNATDDPEGIVYGTPGTSEGEKVLQRNLDKLRAAGHDDLADRVRELGP